MKRNMLSTASTNTPSYRMLMRLKPLQSAPLNASEEIINLGYLQQDKDALDFVHCFTNTKPLNVYQSSTKNKSQVQPNALYLHFPSAVEKGIMRCLERKKTRVSEKCKISTGKGITTIFHGVYYKME